MKSCWMIYINMGSLMDLITEILLFPCSQPYQRPIRKHNESLLSLWGYSVLLFVFLTQLDETVINEIATGNAEAQNKSLIKKWCQTYTNTVRRAEKHVKYASQTCYCGMLFYKNSSLCVSDIKERHGSWSRELYLSGSLLVWWQRHHHPEEHVWDL